jgi:hypothetical protein
MLEVAKAEAPEKQLSTEVTDPTRDSNAVLVAPISPPKKHKTDCDLYKSIIKDYNWDWDIAYQVMKLESNCNPNALNDNPNTGDYSVGLFQINLMGGLANERPSEEWLKVPENNIAYAHDLYTAYGWRIWTTYRKIK